MTADEKTALLTEIKELKKELLAIKTTVSNTLKLLEGANGETDSNNED